eukprot:9386099-Pyramimonas_sp.AAC.1
MLARSSHASWPHGGLHRKSQWRSPLGGAAPQFSAGGESFGPLASLSEVSRSGPSVFGRG